MLVLEDISLYTPKRGLCLTIGNFDGLHLGHQTLIKRSQVLALKNGLDFAVMTFWPHPRTVVAASSPHFPLTDRTERLRLLEAMAVPLVFELTFDKHLSAMSAREFVEHKLLPLKLSCLVIGHDFSMGHGRDGTSTLLEELGATFNFSLERIPAIMQDDKPISSSRLREAISNGDVEKASQLLGRNYSVLGKIVHGDARGRVLGFPTANLGDIRSLIPAQGIYACLAHVNGKILPAATSIGTNPTFDGKTTTVETFLIEGGENLYGQDMRLEFISRIRGQRKFASPEELAHQISLDVKQIRKILATKGYKA